MYLIDLRDIDFIQASNVCVTLSFI